MLHGRVCVMIIRKANNKDTDQNVDMVQWFSHDKTDMLVLLVFSS